MDLWYFAKPNQSFDNIFANFYDNKLQSQKKTAQSYFKNPLEGPQCNIICLRIFSNLSQF